MSTIRRPTLAYLAVAARGSRVPTVRSAAETVWKSNGGGTGGGVSVLFAKPAYQANVNVPKASAAKGGRGVPDVSGDADPDSGYRIVTGGQTGLVGGTSAVAPLWAAIAALLNSTGQSYGRRYARKAIRRPHPRYATSSRAITSLGRLAIRRRKDGIPARALDPPKARS